MKKKKSSLILRIPEPCGEGWSNMQPTANGRHCHSCSRELIDFTQWSDSRLVAYLRDNNGKLCGHFSSRQLNRNLLPAMQTAPSSYHNLSLPALVLLAVTMTAGGAFAAEHPAPPFSLVELAQKEPKDTLRATYTFPGLVLDKNTLEPLPFVRIVANAGGVMLFETYTDIDGLFNLEIPAEIATFQLTLSYIGYEKVTIIEQAENANSRNQYQLSEEGEVMLDGMLIVISKEEIRQSRRAQRKAERQMQREGTKTD